MGRRERGDESADEDYEISGEEGRAGFEDVEKSWSTGQVESKG